VLASEGPEFDDDPGDDQRWPAPDPDDRLWRHPSEIPTTSPRAAGSLRRGRQLGGAVLAAGLAGAGITTTRPATYMTPPGGSAVGIGPGVVSLIMSRLPGIVAVDVAGPNGTQQGTGLILQPDGVILTTSQLVHGATTITVTSSDGQEWNANLLGTDSTTGAAVIRVPATGLTVIPVDASNDLQAGSLSVVVSASGRSGVHFQTSIGLFSGVDQEVNLDGGNSVTDAIVTDSVPPNPMGAILLDDQGRVVGILRSVISHNGTTSAVATPIALSKQAAASLLAGQMVIHAWLGVTGPSQSSQSSQGGARVTGVAPASPAALAGVRPGDLVTSINGQAVPSMSALTGDIEAMAPGSSVILSVNRAGASLNLSATLEGKPQVGG
jgi:S1-C subfamily serine protease